MREQDSPSIPDPFVEFNRSFRRLRREVRRFIADT